jgi:hypothetical protein
MKIAKYQPTLSLKPTQFSLGLVEIEYKVKMMSEMSKHKLQKFIDKHPIPVVLSPWKELCVTDHHHFLFACWHANVKKVRVEVVKDYSHSKLSYVQFWKQMAKLNYAYLMDQFGDGPRSPLYLPSDIRGMADDPYRSLAWIVRKEGAYEKNNASFSEFIWANFFRSHSLLSKQGKEGLKHVVGKAHRLAVSEAAKGLPGYISPKKKAKDVDANLAQTSYIVNDELTGPLATTPNLKMNKAEKLEEAANSGPDKTPSKREDPSAAKSNSKGKKENAPALDKNKMIEEDAKKKEKKNKK